MGITDEAEPAAPDRSRRARVPVRADRSVRVLLLAVLLVGAVASLLPRFASAADVGAFEADLASGRVAVATVESGGSLRWSPDWLRWRRAEAPGGDHEAWLRDRVAASGRPVAVVWVDGGLQGRVAEPAWPPLRWAVLGAGLASLVLMFARRRRWLADRSGWFWLFFGGLGAPVFLLLEPEPLWSRPGRLPGWSRWRRLPIGGLGGFLLGWIGVSAVLIVVDLVG